MEVIEGIVEDLDRVTHTSGGGGETTASTSHIALFKLKNFRVKLSLRTPAMISNGDTIRICGKGSTGEFSAIYCKNITTGWNSPMLKQGCAKSMLMIMTMGSGFLTIFFKPIFLMTAFCLILLFLISKGENQYKKAKELVDNYS